jgi:hypothetical protein
MSTTPLSTFRATMKKVTPSSPAKAVKAFLPAIEKATEEAASLQRSLQEAEIAEPNPAKRAHYEEAFQKIGAIRRIAGELTVLTRTLVQAYRELQDVHERMAASDAPPVVAPGAARAAAQPRSVKQKVVKSKPER